MGRLILILEGRFQVLSEAEPPHTAISQTNTEIHSEWRYSFVTTLKLCVKKYTKCQKALNITEHQPEVGPIACSS